MLDHFIYGKVERISPEAPVPVFNYKNEKKMLGGAGNVVANLHSLGCSADVVCFIGRDSAGNDVQNMLNEVCDNPLVIEATGFPTIEKTRIIAGNNHLLRIDTEKKFDCLGEAEKIFNNNIEKRIEQADIVLLSDYAKGLLSEARCRRIIELSNKLGKKVLVDPKGDNYEKYRGATLIKPNLKEFQLASGITCSPEQDDFNERFRNGAVKLFNKHGFANLLVTLSEHGMAFISAAAPEDVYKIPTEAKEVFDVSGAGDTSLATFGAAIAAGAEIRQAITLANIASGIAVGKLGTSRVSAEEIEKKLAAAGERRASSIWTQKTKIITSCEAAKIAENYRAQGRKVGFTNGCFDLLHKGHLYSLMQAKGVCDILMIGLNSDNSVKRLKGNSRPIQDENTRALLLASLEFVDYVILFDDDTALPLVMSIRPDIILKEGYTPDKWPEAQAVQSYGGKAVTLSRLDGYSTTETLRRVYENSAK